jgi:hypothetical protein
MLNVISIILIISHGLQPSDNSNFQTIPSKQALFRAGYNVLTYFILSGSTCQDQCGVNTWCTGDWAVSSSFRCSCFDGYSSPTNDGKACTGLMPCYNPLSLVFKHSECFGTAAGQIDNWFADLPTAAHPSYPVPAPAYPSYPEPAPSYPLHPQPAFYNCPEAGTTYFSWSSYSASCGDATRTRTNTVCTPSALVNPFSGCYVSCSEHVDTEYQSLSACISCKI